MTVIGVLLHDTVHCCIEHNYFIDTIIQYYKVVFHVDNDQSL